MAFTVCATAQAATHILNGVDRPALCSGELGSWSGTTYVCSWGDPFKVAEGDSVVSTRNVKILSYNGFDLVNSFVGGNGYTVDLEAQGSNKTKLNGTVLRGSILGPSNNVELAAGAKVYGSVSVTGGFRSNSSMVTGNVSADNGITAVDTTFQGDLTTSSGAINLNGGSVKGLVQTNCCTITTKDADLLGGVQANSGITIDGGEIDGDLRVVNANGELVNNDIDIRNAVMTSGDINAFNVQVSNSQIGSAKTPVEILARGNYLNLVNNTTVYGHVEVTNTYGTITIEPGSRVVGTCLADTNRNPNVNNNVIGECGGGGVPPDPPDPVECGVSLEVGPMIAGKSHFAKITALDEPLSCKPPSVLEILFKYPNPDTKHHNPESIWVNGEEIKEGEAKEISNIEWSEKEVRLNIEYKEAGALYLAVLGADDEILSEDNFVSRPYGFCIKPLQDAPISENGSAESIDFYSPVRFKAGDPIPVSITAVRWEGETVLYGSVDEPLLAKYVCDNAPTKNYRQSGYARFKEEPKLIQPVGNPGGASGRFNHLSGNDDFVPGIVIANVTLDEVGFFRVQMKEPPKYLGEDMSASISESKIIGRIIPAWLDVSGVARLNSCDGFSYQRELVPYAVSPKLTVTGKNRQEGTTNNYDRGAFWRLPKILPSTWWTLDGVRELTNNLTFPEQVSNLSDAEDPDGQRTYEWFGDGLKYDFSSTSPGADDLPFSILQRFSATALRDDDGACYSDDGGETCREYDLEILDSEIRLGRLRIANAHGSEQLPLALPWMIESWQAPGAFLLEGDDTCSAPVWSEPDLIDPTGDLVAIPTPKVSTIKPGHQGVLTVAAPEVTGSGRVGFPGVPRWLWYDWRGEGREPSRGLATFGIYKGPKPLIFRRELYRGM